MSDIGSPQLDARTEDLSALYRIAATGLSDDEDLDAVISESLRTIDDVVACRTGQLFIYSEEDDALCLHTLEGDNSRKIPLSEPSIARRVFLTGTGEVINDTVVDPDFASVDAPIGRQLVAVPLMGGGRRMGVLTAIDSHRGAFTDRDLRFLTILADRVALRLLTTELRSRIRRQDQELEGLHRLSRIAASPESVEHVIGESVHLMSELVGCQKMAVLLYDDSSDQLVAQQPALGLTDDEVRTLRLALQEPSLTTTVFRTGTALISNDAATDGWVSPTLRAALGIETLMIVPMHSAGKVIGVVKAINATGGRFDDEDLRFITLLAGRVGGIVASGLARERERALVQKLREADQTKTDFVSMLAHELKGPMTTIKGFGDILATPKDKMSDEKRDRMVEIIRKEIERLSRLVSDLLDVTRMEAGSLRYEPHPFSLRDLVESIVSVHPSLRQDHAISVEIPDDLPKVDGDQDRIRQVLINLLTNATRYSPEGTRVRVYAHESEDARQVVVGVQDEGIGIAPDDIDRLFAKFSMLPKPAWVKKGTGLGLFITKGIVEGHGGRIWVESKPGEGSTFFFSLPSQSDESSD